MDKEVLQHLLDEQKLNMDSVSNVELLDGSYIQKTLKDGDGILFVLFLFDEETGSRCYHSKHVTIFDAIRTWRLCYYGV